jgi:hypothetical protein
MKAPAVSGLGQGEKTGNFPPDTAPDHNRQRIDLRLAFLACAAARFDLVEAGAMTLDEAFSRDFVERYREIGRLTCQCEREILDRFDTQHREICERRLRAWRWSRS